MAGNALPDGTQVFEFGGRVLHGVLRSFQDSRQRRVALHEYDRRDGAIAEDMGRTAHVLRGTLYFTESSGFAEARAFIAQIERTPIDLLVHPIYGRMRAHCGGLDGASLDVDQAANAYTMPVTFTESALDGRVLAAGAQGVAGAAGTVTAQASAVGELTASFPTAAAELTAASNAASTFAAAAEATLSAATATDPSLTLLGNTAMTQIQAARAAVIASGATGAAAALAQLEALGAAVMDLGAADLARRPPLVEYVVQEAVHVLVLAQWWYGGSAASRVDEILANNPGAFVGRVALPGTRLWRASV